MRLNQRIWARYRQTLRQRPALRNLFYGIFIIIGVWALLKVLPEGTASSFFKLSGTEAYIPVSVWHYRANRVRTAFIHAYHGYELHASPQDELRPVTNGGMSKYNAWGVTAFDSLDTMLLLGLNDEYKRALEVVKATDFTKATTGYIPYFETIIRYLGGLLSAYALSKDEILLQRAEELANILDPIFTESGMPLLALNPANNRTKGPAIGVLAEIASFQLEYTYLAKVSGKKAYYDRVNKLNRLFVDANLNATGGMLPIHWDLSSGKPHSNELSVGARADSAHEYLLKQYLLTAKTDKANLAMYLRATTHIITNLLYLSPKRRLLYVTNTDEPTHKELAPQSYMFEHLSCFLPGLLALGAHSLPLDRLETLGIRLSDLGDESRFGHAGKAYHLLGKYNLKQLHLWAAEGLAQTCWLTYADQPSGLGPDEIVFRAAPPKKFWDRKKKEWSVVAESYLWMDAVEKWKESGGRGPIPGVLNAKPVARPGKDSGRDYIVRRAAYLLRPETVESFYILWRVTGDVKWRTRGWSIFEAIEREAKTESGYTTLKHVDVSPAVKGDTMPSFFLAETLKYLYLLFSEDDPIPLDKWVFNTEAHPLPIFQWTEKERMRFNIA